MKHQAGRCAPFVPSRLVPLAAVAALLANGAAAMELATGNSDVTVRWDNTVKYSAAARVKSQDPALLTNPNNDDGNRNFDKGLISNRFDLLSELDVVYQRTWGGRISVAAWYDSIYNRTNDNPGFPGGAFPNQVSVPYNEFTRETRDIHGRQAEVLDAFLFGKFDVGGRSASVRVGQHSLLWGESLFFGANAIAGGQQPVDVVKLASVPNTQFKEAVRPVPQLSGQYQINSHVSLAGYYQFRWDKARLPGVGSYFSNADPAPDGAESLLLGPGVPPALRGADMEAKDSGQGGLQIRVRSGFADYGLYAIRYHAKTPQLVPRLVMTPVGPAPGDYYLAYHQGTKAFGASASKTFGNFNVAIEGSVRDNVDLASTRAGDASAFAPVPPTDNRGNPGYAVGRTAHLNISTIGSIGSTPLWREANLVGEVAWNRLLKVTKNAAALDPNGTREGLALRVTLEPIYRGVLDGVDIGIPLGLSWAPKGSRPLAISNPNAWIPEGGGDLTIGVNASYRDAWRFSLAYTRHHGPKATFNDPSSQAFTWRQARRDRDFVSASVTYTF